MNILSISNISNISNNISVMNHFLFENGFEPPTSIGEGIHCIVFYTKKEHINDEYIEYIEYIVKIYKSSRDLAREMIVLRKMGDFVKEINPSTYLLKYRGESLDKIDITRIYSLEICLEKLMEMLTNFHKKGYLHNDIKPDNVCYDTKNDSFHLVDMGNISSYMNYTEHKDHKEYKENKYFRGNMFWSLRACTRSPYEPWCAEDDIESLLLMVWHLYYGPLPWLSLMTNNITNKEKNINMILMQREDVQLCPHPLLCDLLQKNRCLKKNK